MKRYSVAALSAIAFVLAGHALATDPTPAPATAPSTPAVAQLPPPSTPSRLDPNVVICKRHEETGTRLGATSICHTRQEWADQAAAARTKTDHMEEGPRITPQ